MKLLHACERHDQPADKRLAQAWASWDVVYSAGVVPCHVWEPYPRTAKSIGDPRALPYLKDILKPALDQASDEDIVFFTNSDNYLDPTLPEMLSYHCSIFGPCCSQRCEFRGRPIPPADQGPGAIARIGRRHMGRDLFAATKAWWLSKWEQIGDPILGASDFDLHLCAIIRLHYGLEFSRRNIEVHLHPSEIPLGFVAHKYHRSAWAHPSNQNTAPSQKWNRSNFKRWAEKHLPNLQFNRHDCI